MFYFFLSDGNEDLLETCRNNKKKIPSNVLIKIF